MTQNNLSKFMLVSLVSITITSLVTTIHHVYRMGFEVLIPFSIITILPIVAIQLYRHREQRWILWGYGFLNTVIFVWFGFIDGFLDHTLKALGIQNVTFLEGSDEAVVKTAFSLGSPELSNFFYEVTGVITFIASVVAIYYTYQLLHKKPSPLSPSVG
jgi:hypothetical protein